MRTRVGYGGDGGGLGVFGEFFGKKCIIMRFLAMNYLVESENCCIFASERVVFALEAGVDACALGQAMVRH